MDDSMYILFELKKKNDAGVCCMRCDVVSHHGLMSKTKMSLWITWESFF